MFVTEIENVFLSIMRKEKEVSAGVAAIRTLLKVLEHDKCKFYRFTIEPN